MSILFLRSSVSAKTAETLVKYRRRDGDAERAGFQRTSIVPPSSPPPPSSLQWFAAPWIHTWADTLRPAALTRPTGPLSILSPTHRPRAAQTHTPDNRRPSRPTDRARHQAPAHAPTVMVYVLVSSHSPLGGGVKTARARGLRRRPQHGGGRNSVHKTGPPVPASARVYPFQPGPAAWPRG